MTPESLSHLMLDIVAEQDGAIFSQFQERMGPESESCAQIRLVQFPNVVLWTNVSQLFADGFNLVQPHWK